MKLFFRKYGETGPPMIIVHGLYGASDNWVSVARELSAHYEVFVVDQRNHGDSPHDSVHTYEAMRDDLLGFMDEHNIKKAVLLGHSMGGKTVMSLAMSHPERISSLIVVDIAPVSYNDLAVSSVMTANHSKMIDAMLEIDVSSMESREEVSRALSVKIGSERIRMFLLKNLTRNKKKEFCWKINLPVLKENLEEIMDGLHTEEFIRKGGVTGFPVLFVRGENSDYIQPKDHNTIKRLFPAAEIVSIPNSGHWVHAEQPDLLIKTVNYFGGN